MKMSINLAEDLIKNLVTLKITKCFRLFYNDEYHFLSKETMFSKSDGNIYIQFSNNKLLAFYAYTEEFTIYMESIENDGIPNNVIDITDDSNTLVILGDGPQDSVNLEAGVGVADTWTLVTTGGSVGGFHLYTGTGTDGPVALFIEEDLTVNIYTDG